MRKRLLATVMAGAIAAAGILTFAACGGGDDGSGTGSGSGSGEGGSGSGAVVDDLTDGKLTAGEQVTAEEWKKAVEAIFIPYTTASGNSIFGFPLNYTVGFVRESTITYSGGSAGGVQVTDVNYSSELVESGMGYTSYTTEKIESLWTGDFTIKFTDFPDELKNQYLGEERKYTDVTTTVDGKVFLSSDFNNEGDFYVDSPRAVESYNIGGVCSHIVGSIAYGVYWDIPRWLCEYGVSKEKGGEKQLLYDLYEAFTYSNGFYSARVWANSSSSEDALMPLMITLSVKDNYLVGITIELNLEPSNNITQKMKCVFEFGNFGTTTVPEYPQEALDAIDKYIKEQEEAV